jgi:hypothetical protein
MVLPPGKVIFDQWLLVVRLQGLLLWLGKVTFDLFLALLRSPEDVLLWLTSVIFDLRHGNLLVRSHQERKPTRRRDASAPDCKEFQPRSSRPSNSDIDAHRLS